jgi:hypothetical protein
MTQYASYNPTVASPSPVTGWYDTALFPYPNLPPATDLLEVTAAQWAARLANPSGWAVSSGALVAYTPPAPALTLAQQATAQLKAGVAVTFATSAGLSATYTTTTKAQVKIMAEANWLIKNGTFINGTSTLILVDATGAQRAFNVAQFAAFQAAYAPYISAVDLVADSNEGAPPDATLTVDA